MTDSAPPRRWFNPYIMLALAVTVLGCILYFAMFYFAGYDAGQNDRKAQTEAQHYASETVASIERDCPATPGPALNECIRALVAVERESQRGESDLAAQWQAAEWVKFAGFVAAVQLLATIVGLYFIKGTLDLTAKAVAETVTATRVMSRQNDIAVAHARPYLSTKKRPISWSYDYLPMYRIVLGFDIENVGATAATDFGLEANMSIEVDGDEIYSKPLDSIPHPSVLEPRVPMTVELAHFVHFSPEALETIKGKNALVTIKGAYFYSSMVTGPERIEFVCLAKGAPVGANPEAIGSGLIITSLETKPVTIDPSSEA